MIALSKGLSAPVGSVVVGSADFIAKARKKAKMLGGGMRQAGLIAAPALVALENPYPQLQRDHAMALRLAEGLRAIDERLVDMASVQTNIVNCYLDAFAAQAPRIVQGVKEEGVRALASQNGLKIRFVTHRHIDDESVDACIAAMRRVFTQMQAAA
jgi:threonine aldolase